MKFTSPTVNNHQISVVIESLGSRHRAIVSGAGNHPQTAIVKTTLSIAKWQVTQIGEFYTVRSHEASLKAIQVVCEEIKRMYGI